MSRWISFICIPIVLLPGRFSSSSPFGFDLVEGHTLKGVYRHPVVELHPELHADSPSVAVLPDGRVVVAFVVEENDQERIWLRWAKGPDSVFGKAQIVSSGERASHPRLAAASDGSVWLTWCGWDVVSKRGVYERQVFLRKISPDELGPVLVASASGGWSCAPRIAIGAEGEIHLVWEQGSLGRIGIAYRAFSRRGEALGPIESITRGSFARRPDVCVAKHRLHVVWDELVSDVPTGKPDPDYDVFLRSRIKGKWQRRVAVDTRAGIQAAPSLALDPRGRVLVGYHSTHRHPVVKWWTIRRVDGRKVEAFNDDETASEAIPQGQRQGAEFPMLLSIRDGILVLSRPSQGAYIQLVDASGIGSPLNLARSGWGVRGIQTEMVEARDGSILAVRRARSRIVLERFWLSRSSAGLPVFNQVFDFRKKKSLQAQRSQPPPIHSGHLRVASKWRLLFGDLHMHSAMSDGTGPADEVLARAWSGGLDFAALTDHDTIVGFGLMPSRYDEIAWVTDVFNAKKGFATLHAFEWTTAGLPKGSGHRNVYFRQHAPRKICRSIDGCPNTSKLQVWLKQHKAMSIPHHTSWTGTEWGPPGTGFQRLFEVVSIHGASEYLQNQPIGHRGSMQGMFARDGLRRGFRFGFVGGSDSHGLLWHHGVGRKENPWAAGLTGLLATGHRRENLFDALDLRRCFATSGVRMAVWVGVGDIGMGGEGVVDLPVDVDYEASGTRKLSSLEVVRDGQVVARLKPEGITTAGTWRDNEILEPGWHSYYLRVVQGASRHVELAWSSPVFVRVERRTGKK